MYNIVYYLYEDIDSCPLVSTERLSPREVHDEGLVLIMGSEVLGDIVDYVEIIMGFDRDAIRYLMI